MREDAERERLAVLQKQYDEEIFHAANIGSLSCVKDAIGKGATGKSLSMSMGGTRCRQRRRIDTRKSLMSKTKDEEKAKMEHQREIDQRLYEACRTSTEEASALIKRALIPWVFKTAGGRRACTRLRSARGRRHPDAGNPVDRGRRRERGGHEHWDTALHMASLRNMAGHVRWLIVHGANVKAVNHVGQTPLHVAAERGHLLVCECLVDNCASIRQKDNALRTPLALAKFKGHRDVVSFFHQCPWNLEMARNDRRRIFKQAMKNVKIALQTAHAPNAAVNDAGAEMLAAV